MNGIMQGDILRNVADGSHGCENEIADIDEATNVNAIKAVRDCSNRQRYLLDQNAEGIVHSKKMPRVDVSIIMS